MLETLSRIIEVAAKYAWGALVVCLFVILVPSGTAGLMGLAHIKQDYVGWFWLGLVFATALWGGSIVSRFWAWHARRRRQNDREEAVLNRLTSLDREEYAWIAFCLLRSCQTLAAPATNRTANSLVNKGVLVRGSGSILELPYHITDFVWEHLQDHRDSFLPPQIRDDPEMVRRLEGFAKNLKDPLSA